MEDVDFDALEKARPARCAPRLSAAYMARVREWMASNERVFDATNAEATLELSILDTIGEDFWSGGGITAKTIKAKLDANPNAKTVRVLLNSPGGDAFEGLAIRSLLRRHGARVIVEVLGWAASAASVIAMAGDEIIMHEGSLMMVHKAWTIAMGESGDLRETADFLDKIDSSILDVYERRTGKSREEIATLVAAETWMTANEAVEQKFADSVIPASAGDSKPKPEKKSRAATSQHTPNLALNIAINSIASEPRAVADSVERALRAADLGDFATVEFHETPQTQDLETPPTPPESPSPEETPPAPEGSDEQPTPSLGEENSMAGNDNTQNNLSSAVARALGLSPGASESDMHAAATRLREFEIGIMALVGVNMSTEAIGAVRGLKAAAEKSDKLQAELNEVKGERDKQSFEVLIAKGRTKPAKLTPASAKYWEDRFDAAVKNGTGESIVNELTGFLAVAPIVYQEGPREPNNGKHRGPASWQGKTYGELKYAERAKLSKENPDLFELMRAEHNQAGA